MKIQDIKKKTLTITRSGKTKLIYKGTGKKEFQKEITFVLNKPDIKHEIIIKAVLWGHSYFDLSAKLRVNKGAKNTNTYLKIECLLVSENARTRIIPGLEIMEDAVKSGHGATVSSINKEQLNYLQSRGLNKKEAENLIIKGFLN